MNDLSSVSNKQGILFKKKLRKLYNIRVGKGGRTHEIYQFISGVDVAKGETHLTQKGTWLEF